MSNEMIVYQNFDQIQRAAVALQKSGYFKDVSSEAQAIVKVLAGAELGLPPFASMTGIHIIQGKPVLGANVMATLVKNDPRYDYHVKVCTDADCIIEWYEAGKLVGESGFTMKEANAAGLTGKDNWKKFPSDMLFARAISRGARRFAPGIFGGSPVYTPDEMGADVDPEGYTVTVEAEEVKQDAPPPAEQPETEPAPMSLETAENIVNSDGVRYGDLPSDKLSVMTIGINKGLKNPALTDDERELYLFKRTAISVILQSRNGEK